MSRRLFLGTLGTLLFAGPFFGISWAQNKPPPVPPFLETAKITFQLGYSCPGNTACSFACPRGGGAGRALGAAGGAGAPGAVGGPGAGEGLGAAGGFFGASHVTKLTIYLGTMPLATAEILRSCFMIFQRERDRAPAVSASTLD